MERPVGEDSSAMMSSSGEDSAGGRKSEKRGKGKKKKSAGERVNIGSCIKFTNVGGVKITHTWHLSRRQGFIRRGHDRNMCG